MAIGEAFRVSTSVKKSIKRMISLKVDNLPYRTTTDSLNEVFSKYGEIGDVYIPRDYETAESRGFAFVRFFDIRDAEDAMGALNGRVFDGRPLRIQFARYGRPGSPAARRGCSSRSRSRSCSVPGCRSVVPSCCCLSRSCSSSRSPSPIRSSRRRRTRSGKSASGRRRYRSKNEKRRGVPSRRRSGKEKRYRSYRRHRSPPLSSSSYSSEDDDDDRRKVEAPSKSDLSENSLTESAKAREKEL